MKKLFLLAVMAATCGLSTPYCYAEPLGTKPEGLVPVDGFRLSIMTPQSDFAVGTSIPIIIFLTNVTKEKQYVGASPDFFDYKIEVTTSDGEVIPLTRLGQQKERFKIHFSQGLLAVASGDNYATTFNINTLFDMSVPGTYRIKVSHYIKGEQKGAKPAVSNMVQITVR